MMGEMRKHFEALQPGAKGPITNEMGENPTSIGVDLTNLLLIKLLEK